MKHQNSLKNRIELFQNILKPKKGTVLQKTIAKIEFSDENELGSPIEILEGKKTGKLNTKELQKLDDFADLLDDNESLTKCLFEKSKSLKINSIRDLALNYNAVKLCDLFHANQIPKEYPGETQKEKEVAFGKELEKKIFQAEPSATLQRLIRDKQIDLLDKNVESGVKLFFDINPEFNIKKESILNSLSHPEALKGIKEDQKPMVIAHLKTLQRITAISPSPKTVEVLFNKKMHSASQISQLSEGNFMKRYGDEIGQDEAKQVYRNAIAVKKRNEQALMTIMETLTPTGVAMIDNSIMSAQVGDIYPLGEDVKDVTLSYEALFGSADYCECGHCNSVYSPSAYFVELLQYIRNNNLDPANVEMVTNPSNPSGPKIQKAGYADTPLEFLFARRPDLKCLDLTCANAYTVLPYIDLANEVMESYVALENPIASPLDIQVDLAIHNTGPDDESETLLAQPQNIKKKAYCTLSTAVFPFTLPYNQPIDAQRIFLDHLGTSRDDLMENYRPYIDGDSIFTSGSVHSPTEIEQMAVLEHRRYDRALCAEKLLMTEQEYVILTKEAFASKERYELHDGATYTDLQYQDLIELKSIRDHYFHTDDGTPTAHLELVKAEFLPRTGLTYIELVDLLKTYYINPYQPIGEVKNILEILNIPYATMASKVRLKTGDPEIRYAELIKFIHTTYHQQQIARSQNPDPCSGEIDMMDCLNKCDIETWVYYYFEKLGQMIVLESNNDLHFKYPGKLIEKAKIAKTYNVTSLGLIVNDGQKEIGKINPDLTIKWNRARKNSGNFVLHGLNGLIAKIKTRQVEKKTVWHVDFAPEYRDKPAFEIVDTCDISKVRLRHLNGTALTVIEWDKMQRFIRLWRKLDWSLQELDSAILGLSATDEEIEPYSDIKPCVEDRPSGSDDCGCSKLSLPIYTIGHIDSELICQLASIKSIQEELRLSRDNLLTFWNNIETQGADCLYARLFLKRNLRSLDPVFEANGMNAYLTDPSIMLSQHIPAIMAGLNIEGSDITLLDQALGLSDEMTLENISIIYRHQLLSRLIGQSIAGFLKAKELIGDPFIDGNSTQDFLIDWNKLEDSKLDLHELLYINQDVDDGTDPITLPQAELLRLSKVLYEGIQAIDDEHGDIIPSDFTIDILRQKLELIMTL